jgi:tRNA/tmRNA/rRNA uracil-C5-methylase (TrmA/RlmC/RlmD family)
VTTSVPDRPEAGDLVEVTVGEAVHGGWCVARPAAGPAIFVRHALPGERVRAVITQRTSKLARADATEILEASADRVPPPCPHAHPGGCGGCDWQHASLPAQRSLKAAVVRQQLRRIAGIDWDVSVEAMPGDDTGLGWRTRVTFAVGRDGVAGLRRHRSHDIMEIGDCPIAHPLVAAAEVTRRNWPGAAWVEVTAAPGSDQRAVIIGGDAPAPEIAADTVLSERAGQTGRAGRSGRAGQAGRSGRAGRTGQAGRTERAGRTGRAKVVRGSGYLRQRAAGRDWRVSAAGFWQVHPGAADTLAAAVLDALRPQPGEVALDLYCGAGLFAGVLAGAVGPSGTVIGIEADPAAVRDARHNLRHMPWARVHRGDAALVLARNGLSGASLAVADPPRTGLARPVIELLSAPSSPGPDGRTSGSGQIRRIAYVSCDPATLARDIALLRAAGWNLEALRAFDAFPMTHHVECLATLARSADADRWPPPARDPADPASNSSPTNNAASAS